MSSEASDAAGPSTAPAIFKKRSRTVTSVLHRPSRILEEDKPGSREPQGDDGAKVPEQDLEEQDEEAEISVADLVALRNLQRKPTGIELSKLNNGIKKKKKKMGKDKAGMTDEDRWREQMEQGGLLKPGEMRSRAARDDDDDDDEADTVNRSRRLVRQDNFQGETNVIDVDKHMMAYIEEEMRKRRAAAGGSVDAATATSPLDVKSVLSNPEDELYKVAEKYTRLQQEARNAATAKKLISNRSRPDDEDGEGSVGLSSAMLSGIPEVELGMDSRLKNIEDTEKAKRAMLEARKQGKTDEADQILSNARFFHSRRDAQSDAAALANARAAASGASAPQPQSSASGGNGQKRVLDRREMATDDVVMQRFKKRQMNGMKR